MEFSDKYKKLGQILSQKLRDENYKAYLERKEYAKSMSLEEYKQLPRNSNYAPGFQKLDDERFEFLNSLNEGQLEILDRMMLSLLDNTAFNFLREIEEYLDEDESIGITIDGVNVEKITQEFLSGTMFGEYFLWIENYSKYGKFQH
ncbi:MAG: hypothetical protein HKN39_06440 [Flavobacteriales bacterium]|nr:hypothetical protein [Flavobacteriales bacterium]